jgi:hypothetical protein
MAMDTLPAEAPSAGPISPVPSLVIPITTASNGMFIEMFPEEVRETSASMLLSGRKASRLQLESSAIVLRSIGLA